jgi:hypothetical protein
MSINIDNLTVEQLINCAKQFSDDLGCVYLRIKEAEGNLKRGSMTQAQYDRTIAKETNTIKKVLKQQGYILVDETHKYCKQ